MQDVTIPLIAQAAVIYSAVVMTDISALNRPSIDTHLREYDYNNQVRLLAGCLLPAQVYQKAQRLRQLLRDQITAALDQVDVLVLPTACTGATPIPEQAGVPSKQAIMENFMGRRSYTTPFSLSNNPALSVPCGFTSERLPIGLQIVGRPFAEETVLRVSHAYEHATAWHKEQPPELI